MRIRKTNKAIALLLTAVMVVAMFPAISLTFPQKANAAVSTWDGSVSTSFSGAGTAASPYIIDTAAKLAGVAQLTNNNTGWSGGKYMVLTADIDLANRQWTPIGIQRQNGGGTTYSEANAWFRGYFDGNGHVIKNVRVGTSTSNRASVKHVGLFGIVGSAARILNLGVETAQYYINHYCDDERVGGFVGYNSGVIQGCYVRNVTIDQNGVCVIGGFCGQSTSSNTIYKCYAYNVSLTQGSGRWGGFVGDGYGTTAFCFVNKYPFQSSGSDGSFTYCYGEANVTGAIVGNGGNTGYGPESFTSGGNNGGWPQLIWQTTGPLDYNASEGYIVDSAAKLRSLACFVNNGRDYSGAKIALKADIDLSAYDWAPIGINQTNRTRYFSGTFNGNGYIISNLKIGSSSNRNTMYLYKGLFGYTSNAVINCVGINNAQIYGNGPTDYRCGALVGQADGGSGRIYQCFVKNSTVNMTGTGVSGVIVGDIRHNITDCYTLNSSATGTRAGSVVGDMKSTVYNVYSGANCSSTSNNYTSENKGTPVNCYDRAGAATSAGYVSTFNGYANRTNYTQSSGAWITDIYNINGGYACLKWEPRFNISFNAGGGSVSASPLTGRYQFSGTTPTASRSCYNFNGYYTASSGGTRVIGAGETYHFGTTNPSNSSVSGTLYAQWTPWRHTVAYDANGGSGAPASQTKTYGEQLNLSATVPTRNYYVFTGWNTKQDGSGTDWAAGANYTPDYNGGTVTLYAQWAPWQHTVAYNANGGSGAPASQTKTYGAQLNLSATQPTRTGYHFLKWNTRQDGSGTDWAPGANYTPDQNGGTVTLYAQWEINTYAVAFSKNGTGYTNTTPAASVDHGGSVSFTVTLSNGYTNSANPAVTATNGTISASRNGNAITYTVSNITAATTITVGAATINSYSVTFVNGYTNATLKTEPVNHGSAATAPEAPAYILIEGDGAKHMKFTGWDKAFDNITGELTVTALYEEEIHSFGAYTNDGETHSRTCASCNYVETNAHTYVSPAEADWTWTKTGDGYTATVVVSCEKGDDTRTLTATVSLTEDVAATHLVDGHKTYTATATVGEQTFTAAKTDVLTAEGHHTVYHAAVPSTKCTEFGTVEYWSCEGCDKLFSDENAENEITDISDHTYGPHAYAFHSFVWAEGFASAQAKYVCGNNAEHVELYNADVTVDAHEPDCTHAGYTDYTASYNGNTETKTASGDPATGHTYAAPAEADWSWTKSGDTYAVTVAVSCEKGDDTQTLTASVALTEDVAATHLVDGHKTYTATATIGEQIFTATKTDVVSAEGHSTVHHAAVPSTRCDEYGTIEYWSCAGCDKLFADENAENEITDLSDHTYGDHSFTAQNTAEEYLNSAATCTAKATYFFSCEYCGEKGEATFENGEFDYGNHSTGDRITKNAKDPGYTFKGYTGDEYCAACDHETKHGSELDKLNIDENADVAAAKTVSADAAADPTLYDEDDVATLNDKLAALEAALAIDDNDETVETIIAELKTLVESMDAIVYYNVTFTVDGAEVKTEQVRAGESATAPDEAEYINNGENHKHFSGWTSDYTNVTADVTVAATYETESHSWVDGEITKPATCHETGTQAQSCVCGAQNVKTLPVNSENHVGGKEIKEENRTAGDCATAAAWDEVEYCLGCGNELYRVRKTGEIDPNAHAWGEWTEKTAADCENAGVEERVCANDPGHKETRDIPAKGHNWSAWKVTKDATCKADGIESRICAACGTQENRAIKSTGSEHKWGAWVETKAPTCGEAGEQTRTCSICEETETRPVEKLEHQWGEWVGDDGSVVTCTSGGTQHRECAVCGEIETRSIPGGFGHHVANPNIRGEGYCEYCGEFRCNYCDRLEEFEDIDIIGFFYRIVHFFIHFAHMISYHS